VSDKPHPSSQAGNASLHLHLFLPQQQDDCADKKAQSIYGAHMNKIHKLFLFSLLTFISLQFTYSQVLCAKAPISPALNADETSVGATYNKVLADAAGCTKAADTYCAVAHTDLAGLQSAALQSANKSANCAVQGEQPIGTSLPAADKDWYTKRAAFWLAVYQDMAKNMATVTDGTYKISSDFQTQFLGLPASAPAPSVADVCSVTDTPDQITSTEKLLHAWPGTDCLTTPATPASKTACSAAAQKLMSAVSSVEQTLQHCAQTAGTTGQYNQAWFAVEADNWQPLEQDMVLHAANIYDGSYKLPANWATPIHPTPSPYAGSPYVRALLGGTYSAASGTDPQGKLLADVFIDLPLRGDTKVRGNTKVKTAKTGETGKKENAPAKNETVNHLFPIWAWGYTRIGSIGKAQSAVDPSQIAAQYAALSNAQPGTVVQSFEMNAGMAVGLANIRTNVDMYNRLTLSVIAGGGALTPLSPSQTQPQNYQVNAAVEAAYPGDYTKCTDTAMPPNPYNCYLQLYTQDRSRFFRDYEFGLRLKAYPKPDPNHVVGFPAMFDVTLGRNEYVTGGKFNGAVLHMGGSSPILTSGLYAFGSMDIGIKNSADLPGPLLIPITTPPPTGETIISIATPAFNRDRYTLGIGIDILQLIRSHLLQDALSAVPQK
jgi:hypothetical protein